MTNPKPVATPRAVPPSVVTSAVLPMDQQQHQSLRDLARRMEDATGSHQATMIGVLRVAATEAAADVLRAEHFAAEALRRGMTPQALLAEIITVDGAIPWIPNGSHPGDTPAAALTGGMDPITWVRRACDRRYQLDVAHVEIPARGTERSGGANALKGASKTDPKRTSSERRTSKK